MFLGKFYFVDNYDEKLAALRAISEKYAGTNISGFDSEIAKSIRRTCVCKITIDEITGKANL